MVKGLIRFALIWALTMLLTPYVQRFFERLAERAPRNSLVKEALHELSDRHTSVLIRAFGETLGELVLGARK